MSNNTGLLVAAIADFAFPRKYAILSAVSGAPEGVRHTLPAKNFGQRPIMPILAAAPHIEFAGAAVLFYDNHTLPLRLSLPFFSVVATIQRNDMTQKLAKVAATVQGITESHTILYGRLLVAFEAYAKRQLPPREERISRILDCEGNGAHVLIENFATAIKAVPRGDLESYPDLFLAECTDFLNYLEDNLHSSECAQAIWDIRQLEERFSNFIKGISGADPNISPQEYSHRIDKFVSDLKALFSALGHAIIKLEYELSKQKTYVPESPKEATSSSKSYDKSPSKDWTQKDAAKLLGISTRQLRTYKKNPPKD